MHIEIQLFKIYIEYNLGIRLYAFDINRCNKARVDTVEKACKYGLAHIKNRSQFGSLTAVLNACIGKDLNICCLFS